MAPPQTPEETCEKAYTRAERALTRSISKCKERLAAGQLNTPRKTSIEVEFLDVAWRNFKVSYETLQNDFPNDEVDEENPALSRREGRYNLLEDSCQDIRRDVLLEDQAAEEVDLTATTGRRPINQAKKELDRLVTTVQSGLADIEQRLSNARVAPDVILPKRLNDELGAINIAWGDAKEVCVEIVAGTPKGEARNNVAANYETLKDKIWAQSEFIRQEIWDYRTQCERAVAAEKESQAQDVIRMAREQAEEKYKADAGHAEALARLEQEKARAEIELMDVKLAKARAEDGEVEVAAPPRRGQLRLAKLELPKFDGKNKNYAGFREDWETIVNVELSDEEQKIRIKERVPARDKRNIANMDSMAEVWTYLDKEYGNKARTVADRIKELHEFVISKNATTDAERFEELFQIWRETYCDLRKAELLSNLGHPLALETFQKKLPTDCQRRYVLAMMDPTELARPQEEAMNDWMDAEREIQKGLARLS